MPYKDPERKRQWEREHRPERNARRRKGRLAIGSGRPEIAWLTPDPASDHQPNTGWNVVAGIVSLVVMVGMILIAKWSGVLMSESDGSEL
jgi:hypothetical protein